MIQNQRKEIKEYVLTTRIKEDASINYFKELYANKTEEKQRMLHDKSVRTVVNIEREEIERAVKSMRNRKSPGPDGILNELIRYGGTHLIMEITKLIEKILQKFLISRGKV